MPLRKKRAFPLKHGRLSFASRSLEIRRDKKPGRHVHFGKPPMTICIAAICQYSYGKKADGSDDLGYAVIGASDKMLTDEGLGIKYEPIQGKYAQVATHAIILCADNIAIHSHLIANVNAAMKDNMGASVREVAELYSSEITKFRQDNSAKEYLAPFGLTHDSFIARQKEMDRKFALQIADKLLNYEVRVQALVIGCDKAGGAYIFSVDDRGLVRNHSDIGFVCIGEGHFHANSYFMEHSYWNGWAYWQALMAVHEAKKRAEVAPSVGEKTDMHFICRDGVQHLYPGSLEALAKVHPQLIEKSES